jgi:hypothetical protein
MMRTAQFLAVFLLGIAGGVIATVVVPSVLTPSKPAPFSQAVTQMDFQEDWPLTVRAVMLTCEPLSTVVFTTQDGTRYGLNGLKTFTTTSMPFGRRIQPAANGTWLD